MRLFIVINPLEELFGDIRVFRLKLFGQRKDFVTGDRFTVPDFLQHRTEGEQVLDTLFDPAAVFGSGQPFGREIDYIFFKAHGFEVDPGAGAQDRCNARTEKACFFGIQTMPEVVVKGFVQPVMTPVLPEAGYKFLRQRRPVQIPPIHPECVPLPARRGQG